MALATRHIWGGLPAFDDLYDQMSRMLSSAFPDVSRIRVNAWSPPVDVEETDDAYVIEADMPGIPSDKVDIEVQGNQVHITGKSEEGEKDEAAPRRTRRSGSFDYRLTLPGDVNSESCEADLENGVLKLRLPKTSAAKRRRIPIRGATQPESGSGSSDG